MLQANEAERVGARRSDDEDLVRCSSCHEQVSIGDVDGEYRCKECQPVDDGSIGADERFVREGEIAGRPYRVTAKADRTGFQWAIRVDGQFVEGGYTRSKNVQRAYADAKAAAGLLP